MDTESTVKEFDEGGSEGVGSSASNWGVLMGGARLLVVRMSKLKCILLAMKVTKRIRTKIKRKGERHVREKTLNVPLCICLPI